MTARSRHYLASRRWFERSLALQRAVFDGVSLGLLDPDDLAAVSDEFHATGTECRRRDHNHGGLFRWEEAVLAERFTATTRLVVLAAGAGREVIALARRGIAVDGYEPDPGLRRLGHDLIVELGLDTTIADADPSVVPTFHHAYDGAIVGWGAYSLMTPSAVRIEFLTELVGRLPADAPVLVSAMTRPARHGYLSAVCRTASVLRRVRRRESPELGDTLQPNLTHLFSIEELVGELRSAGLHVVDAGNGDYGWAVGSVPAHAIDLTRRDPVHHEELQNEYPGNQPADQNRPSDLAAGR